MTGTFSCSICHKSLPDANALYNHTKAKHGKSAARKVWPYPQREQSMAEVLSSAVIAHKCGEPVEDWIKNMFPESFE